MHVTIGHYVDGGSDELCLMTTPAQDEIEATRELIEQTVDQFVDAQGRAVCWVPFYPAEKSCQDLIKSKIAVPPPADPAKAGGPEMPPGSPG